MVTPAQHLLPIGNPVHHDWDGNMLTGQTPSSTRCGTHCFALTAHALKACTALSSYRSPHLICGVIAACQ